MEFPKPHIHLPRTPHTHTVILLHGRGSDGIEFAEELLSSVTSQGSSLATCLPSYRWVFPTSRDRWSDRFQEEICSWFDAYSFDNIHERQELQKDGLRESTSHILAILEEEVKLLDERFDRIYLGGISQGMATALWAFFAGTATRRIQQPLGGLVGFCGWLPFAQQLEGLLAEPTLDSSPDPQAQRLVTDLFLAEIAGQETPHLSQLVNSSVLSTPVFLSHGADDVWVSVELGRQACQVLRRIMAHVDWHEFTGAEGDGHWVKEPEGFDQILQFLES
ncbi:hypothetical protein N7457_002377 [Penicillium paradoxum]|uniref:uncharacterized protein n=1 Tax=Penicillium paradoxum TaxID=176176 RepID=UPI0025487EFD|nr:uncharacterized protein N7457_002377 [Penicillium paradoxum]KAJ5787387.1 hypothetical protein N7457_002377 [Penicillium paradoxum]